MNILKERVINVFILEKNMVWVCRIVLDWASLASFKKKKYMVNLYLITNIFF